jgi:hypothetical protein
MSSVLPPLLHNKLNKIKRERREQKKILKKIRQDEKDILIT